MASPINLIFSCVLLSMYVEEHYARESFDGRPSRLQIFHHTCALKMDVGPCKALQDRYYFNTESAQCEKFEYGGCQGNQNNYETVEHCEEACIMNDEKNPCFLPEESGPCRGLVPRYMYDYSRKQCVRFFYGGCYGNANNFKTIKECQDRCQRPLLEIAHPKPNKQSSESTIVQDVTTQPPLVKIIARKQEASAVVTQAPATGTLAHKLEPVEVVTEQSMNLTVPMKQIQEAEELNVPFFCLLPIDRGTCDGSERRYTYNPKKQRCQLFRYSGCGGNRNNFVHKRHCMKMCMKGHNEMKVIRIKKKNFHIVRLN